MNSNSRNLFVAGLLFGFLLVILYLSNEPTPPDSNIRQVDFRAPLRKTGT